MKLKQIFSGVLAFGLAATLALPLAPNAHAASFSDISGGELADNVAVLHTLGVIDGNGKGAFNPNGTLTRAEFCKMAVVMMGQKGAVGQNQSFTIFPDVRANHWAAGYINLALRGDSNGGGSSAGSAGGDTSAPTGSKGIIAGYPDGKFHPDDKITFGQTVTILMRMLGYQDSDVGAVWPHGYLNAAKTNGLTNGLNLSANAPISRANAAKLFSTLLLTDQKDGGSYATKLGTLKNDVILMDTAATAPDGTKNAVKVQDGTVYKTAERSLDAAMAGRKGSLLLNTSDQVLTFIPDKNGTRLTLTVSEALADGIVDTNGKKTEMHSTTVAYYRGEATTYSEIFFNLRPGTAVTVYYNGAGQVEYLFAGAAPSEDSIIVAKDGSTLGFERLTDSKNYTIYKNGVLADVSDLRQYDVATYNKSTNTIRISDTRLTGYYADAKPNIASPSKLTMMGTELNVLPGAAASLSQFKIGQQITVLLTEDNQIAGAADPKNVQGNAIGIATEVSADKAVIELFCGLKIEGNPNLSNSTVGQYIGQLVKVSSYQKGNQISLNRVSGSLRGDLNVTERKLGDASLAANVRIYDKVGNGPLVAVKLSDISKSTIPNSSIVYAEKNYAGQIHILVLNDATGDGYIYGAYDYTPADGDNGATVAIVNKDGKSNPAACIKNFRTGDFGGLAFYQNQNGTINIAGTATLSKLSKVPNSAWNDSSSVTVGSKTYPIASNVMCYNETTDSWNLTVKDARAFANTADLYYDSVGEKIRIIVVKQ